MVLKGMEGKVYKGVCNEVNQCANYPRECHRCNRTGLRGRDRFVQRQVQTRLPGVIPKAPVKDKVLA
tara:strand:+ start:693 stop:893 length:201 start_codon:yes stop_codon:yes gene_type:complete